VEKVHNNHTAKVSKKKSETMEALRQQIETLKATVNTLQQERSNAGSLNTSIPLPKPINVTEGDIAENFKFFQRSWENYLKASGLSKRGGRRRGI
jgi:hypothetical protein